MIEAFACGAEISAVSFDKKGEFAAVVVVRTDEKTVCRGTQAEKMAKRGRSVERGGLSG
jgi:hypothetical protein